jgi:hypothetical protein
MVHNLEHVKTNSLKPSTLPPQTLQNQIKTIAEMLADIKEKHQQHHEHQTANENTTKPTPTEVKAIDFEGEDEWEMIEGGFKSFEMNGKARIEKEPKGWFF